MTDNETSDGSFEHVSTVMHPSTPVKWTPEDAANFIASAIHEAQRPTMVALKQRGVSKVLYVFTCLFFMVLLGGAGFYIYHLIKVADEAQAKKDKIYEDALLSNNKVTKDIVNNARMREELDVARKEAGAQQVRSEKLGEELKTVVEERDRLKKDLKENIAKVEGLTKELAKRKEEIANIDRMKNEYQAEIEKLKKYVSLRDLSNNEQKEEISLLRKRLATLQKMVSSLKGEAEEKPAPAVEVKKEENP